MTNENEFKILKKKSGNLRSPKYAVVFQTLLRGPLIFHAQISYLQFKETVLFYLKKSVSFKRSTHSNKCQITRGRNKNSVLIVNVKNINKQK